MFRRAITRRTFDVAPQAARGTRRRSGAGPPRGRRAAPSRAGARAAETSAHESRTSPARGGRCSFSTGLPSTSPIASASALTLAGAPVATLSMWPRRPAASAAREVRVDDVRDVREVARLLAVAVDRDRLARGDRRDEARHDGGVLRGRVLPRPEDVEVAQRDRLELVDAAEAHAVALGGELRDGVRRDRVRRASRRAAARPRCRRPTTRTRRRRGARPRRARRAGRSACPRR